MLKYLAKLIGVFLAVIMITPALALAHGDDRGDRESHRLDHQSTERRSTDEWVTNEFGVRVFDQNNSQQENDDQVENDSDHNKSEGKHENKDKHEDRGLHLGQFKNRGFFPNMFYNGTVTAVSSTGFTIETKDDTQFVVDADSAKIIQIPRTVVALGDIDVGDTVHITGTKTSDDGINATVVYVMPANLSPAMAKGTVTAVTDDTITVQTGDDTSITVNTNSDTQITNSDHEDVDQGDIEVGMKAKLVGFWDSVLNVFNAIKIKLF